MPQVGDPSHSPWPDPDPALEGCGASVTPQVPPFSISISPHGRPAVSSYQPTVVQVVAEGHDDEDV